MTRARKFDEYRERREAEREANLRALCQPTRSIHRGTYAGGTTGPAPKPTTYRDPVLLEMARGRPCLLMVPAVCNHRTDTTCACHSNLQEHGKGMGIKAGDEFTVHGCAACHYWLDFGKARAEDKLAVFTAAHARQVLTWRLIAMDPKEPERFRKAAQRALARLEMTEEA